MPQSRSARLALGLVAVLVLIAGTACSRPSAASQRPVEGSAAFCADWFRLARESTKFANAQGTAGQQQALRASVEATTVYLEALADSAPSDIRADFSTYARWWGNFSKQMARVNYDFTKIAGDVELQQAMAATTSPEFTQASTNISAWVQQHCTPPAATPAASTPAASTPPSR